jgi:hypothetical protein
MTHHNANWWSPGKGEGYKTAEHRPNLHRTSARGLTKRTKKPKIIVEICGKRCKKVCALAPFTTQEIHTPSLIEQHANHNGPATKSTAEIKSMNETIVDRDARETLQVTHAVTRFQACHRETQTEQAEGSKGLAMAEIPSMTESPRARVECWLSPEPSPNLATNKKTGWEM